MKIKMLLYVPLFLLVGCQRFDSSPANAVDVSAFAELFKTARSEKLGESEDPESISIESNIAYQDTVSGIYIFNFEETLRTVHHNNYAIVFGAGNASVQDFDALRDINDLMQNLKYQHFALYPGAFENTNTDLTGDDVPELLLNSISMFHTDMQGTKGIYAIVKTDSIYLKELLSVRIDAIGGQCEDIIGQFANLSIEENDKVPTLVVKQVEGVSESDCTGYKKSESITHYTWDAKEKKLKALESDLVTSPDDLVTLFQKPNSEILTLYDAQLHIDRGQYPSGPFYTNSYYKLDVGQIFVYVFNQGATDLYRQYSVYLVLSDTSGDYIGRESVPIVADDQLEDALKILVLQNRILGVVNMYAEYESDEETEAFHETGEKIFDHSYFVINSDGLTSIKEINPTEYPNLRNEFFARHGYIFSKQEFKDYFSQFPWYKPSLQNVDHLITEDEKKFVLYLQGLEQGALNK